MRVLVPFHRSSHIIALKSYILVVCDISLGYCPMNPLLSPKVACAYGSDVCIQQGTQAEIDVLMSDIGASRDHG